MNPEIKELWVKALRSGEYKQGTGSLKQNDRFCCLGVLCDVIKYKIDGYWSSDYNGSETFRYPDFNLTDNGGPEGRTHLPNLVKEVAGLKLFTYQEGPLIDMNDSGQDFKSIADHIETYL